MTLAKAAETHLIISGVITAIGLACFFINNQPGTRRSRWLGYWIFGCGMGFYQGCTIPSLVAGARADKVHIYSLFIPLWAMMFGLLVGAVAGRIAWRVVFSGKEEPPADPDD